MKKTENILLEIGITPNLKGFSYICESVEIINKYQRIKMGDIYEIIEKKVGNNKNNIAKAIRGAVKRADSYTYRRLGGSCSTNSEFLYTLALIVKGDDENGK